eukprot:403345428
MSTNVDFDDGLDNTENLENESKFVNRLQKRLNEAKLESQLLQNFYQPVGQYGIFAAHPSELFFRGFEILKTHTQRLRLINNSPMPQRLTILPPASANFKIKYSKKSVIPAGVAEEIYVQFTPNDEYKYYYDFIRIHCESDKILIPLHAFPVINNKKSLEEGIFPTLIDMGSFLKVDNTYKQTIAIESNCPISFKYDIEVLQDNTDVYIRPLSGNIPGLETTYIDIVYTPTTFTRAECLVKFTTNEFNNHPIICKIKGDALPSQLDVRAALQKIENRQSSGNQMHSDANKKISEYDLRKTRGGKFTISDRPQSRDEMRSSSKAGIRLDKLQHDGIARLQLQQVGVKNEDEDYDEMLEMLKNPTVPLYLQNFLREYKRLEDLERDKYSKFFQCIGDPPANEEYRPRWEALETNFFHMRRRLVAVFLKASNRLIIRMRAGKRLTKIKGRFENENIKTRDDVKRMVAEDWKTAQNIRLKEEDNEEDIKNVKFHFNFQENNIQLAQMKLPIEYEFCLETLKESLESTPPINFDDFMPYESVDQLDYEYYRYQKFPQPHFSLYDDICTDVIYRPGCEYESILRQRSGETMLEIILFEQRSGKQQQHVMRNNQVKDIEEENQQFILQQNVLQFQQSMISGAIVFMPRSFLKPLGYDIDLILMFHPQLRNYLALTRQSEVDSDYHVFPLERQRTEVRDELYLRNNKHDFNHNQYYSQLQLDLSTDQSQLQLPYPGYTIVNLNKTVGGTFINTLDVETSQLPGNFGVRLLEQLPTMFANNQSNLARDIGFNFNNQSEQQSNLSYNYQYKKQLQQVQQQSQSSIVGYRHRKNVQNGQACIEFMYQVPNSMSQPVKTDYMQQADDENGNEGLDEMPFTIKIPELRDLMNEFERDDDYLYKRQEDERHEINEKLSQGYELERRWYIKDEFGEKYKAFDDKITMCRDILNVKLPDMIQDVNQYINDPINKIYLR